MGCTCIAPTAGAVFGTFRCRDSYRVPLDHPAAPPPVAVSVYTALVRVILSNPLAHPARSYQLSLADLRTVLTE